MLLIDIDLICKLPEVILNGSSSFFGHAFSKSVPNFEFVDFQIAIFAYDVPINSNMLPYNSLILLSILVSPDIKIIVFVGKTVSKTPKA